MPFYDVEVQYLLPVYNLVRVEAATPEEACGAALDAAENDVAGWEKDYDNSTPNHIAAISVALDGGNDPIDPHRAPLDIPTKFRPMPGTL